MHMKYREEADYRQAMDELCFSQVAKARMTRNLRQSLAQQAEPGPARRTHWKPRIAAVAVAAALVLAVGAAPAVPPVPGIDSPKVIDCVTALTGPDLPGQRVLVVGGGLVGCETALGYAQAGKQVTILEALPDILSAGIPVPEMNDSMLRDLLDEAGVVRRTGRRLSRVTEDGAVADGPDGEEKLSADHIVLAVGFAPRTSLAPELAGAGMEVYQVGDGSRVGSVMTAIGSAYTVGRML